MSSEQQEQSKTVEAGEQTEDTKEQEQEPDDEPSCLAKIWKRWCEFYAVNEFVVLVICAILLARAYPPLGADYLQPQITSTWSKFTSHRMIINDAVDRYFHHDQMGALKNFESQRRG
jgi:hypothetical protein